MRFLLHPSDAAVKSSSAVLSKTKNATSEALQRAAVSLSQNTKNIDGQVVTRPSQTSKYANNNNNNTYTQKAWGQQCSPTCGCVVRFEAHYASDDRKVTHVSYHAKKLVTTTAAQPSATRLQPQLTAKGRPMFEECTCPSLHHLSQASIRHMMQHAPTIPKFQSTLEFQKNRSSPAFARSVLLAQGLPVTDGHCVDVVEDALTALCKGHIPAPRPPAANNDQAYGAASRDDENDDTATSQRQIQELVDEYGECENDDHHNFLKFGHMFGTATQSPPNGVEVWVASFFDTLGILPVAGTEEDERTAKAEAVQEEETAKHTTICNEWVAYVDELQEKLEEQERREDASADAVG